MGHRALIADDHSIARSGLRLLLSLVDGVEVVDECERGPEAVERCAVGDIDLAFIDLTMPGLDGFEVIEQIRASHPSIRTIVCTAREDPLAVRAAIEAGASAFVTKAATPAILQEAIHTVDEGGVYVAPGLHSPLSPDGTTGSALEEGITRREGQVLAFLAEGYSARQIGHRLEISERTVNSHVASLYRRLGVGSRVEAVREAMRRGLLQPVE